MWRLGSLSISFLLAGLVFSDSWDRQSFKNWSPEFARAILTHSPWAALLTIDQDEREPSPSSRPRRPGCATCEEELMQSGVPEPTTPDFFSRKRHFLVRFQTALPVRMALARFAMLSGNMGPAEADDYVKATPFGDHIVIAVWVPPGESKAELDELVGQVPEDQVHLRLRRSKKKIAAKQIVTPLQAGDQEAYFVFPRLENGKELVTVEEKEVEFVCHLSDSLTIKQKFKLKNMVFDGGLAL